MKEKTFNEYVEKKMEEYINSGDKTIFDDPIISNMSLNFEGYRQGFFLSRIQRNYYQSYHTKNEKNDTANLHYKKMVALGLDYLDKNFDNIWTQDEQLKFERQFGIKMMKGLDYLTQKLNSQ